MGRYISVWLNKDELAKLTIVRDALGFKENDSLYLVVKRLALERADEILKKLNRNN